MALLRHPRTRAIDPPRPGTPHGGRGIDGHPPSVPPPPEQRAFYGPLESILRRPLLVVLPAILLVVVAVAIGLLRTPVHTAEARINVGRVDVPAYTLQNVTVGNITLAASYSRAVAAPGVLRRAGRDVGITTDEARERLSASHVPGSTLIRVEAEGDSADSAQQLANAAAGRLIDYVLDLNVRQQESRSLARFRRAQERVERARAKLLRLERGRPSDAPVVEDARLDFRTAELAARSVGNRVFQASVVPPPENLLQLVVPADTADSDKASILQRLALIALVAGLVIGIALALLSTNWHLLRSARR